MIPAAATTFSGENTRAMVFSFLYPEDKAVMAGVSRTFHEVAWKPTYSPRTPSGKRQAHADVITLAYYQEALGNRTLTKAEEGRKIYMQARRWEHLDAMLGAGTCLRAKPDGDLGVEVVKISSLETGNLWARLKNKFCFYSGYQHRQSARSVVNKLQQVEAETSDLENKENLSELRVGRDWSLRYKSFIWMAKGIDAAVAKDVSHLEEATQRLHWVVRLICKIVQAVVLFWQIPSADSVLMYDVPMEIERDLDTSYRRLSRQNQIPKVGVQLGTIDHYLQSLTVHALVTRHGSQRGLQLAISKDEGATLWVSCFVHHAWSSHEQEEVTEWNEYFISHRRGSDDRLKNRRLVVRAIHPMVDSSFVDALDNEVSRNKCAAFFLFQLLAELFDQGGEREIELWVFKGLSTQRIRIRKEDASAEVPIDGDRRMVKWEQFRQEARIHPILKNGKVMPLFFERDLCLYG